MSFINKKIIDGSVITELNNEVIGTGKGGTFGILGANNSGVALHNKLIERHILAIGAIGSGKSNILYHIIKGLRENSNEDDMFIFFDAKGDYYEEFYKDGDMVISNEIEQPLGGVYWNIYEEIMMTHPEKREELIKEIATGIFREDIEKSTAPIFALGARDLFAAILSAQIKDIENGEPMMNHATLVEFLRKASDVTLRNLLVKHDNLKWVRMYIKKENPSQTQSFLVHLYQTVYKIFSGSFEQAGDFSIRRAIQEKGGKAVFLEYDLSAGYILEDIYTLLLDISMKEVLGRSSNGGKNGRVFFVLDEFPLIPRLNYMDNALNFGRSLGVRIIAGLQNIGQVEHRYGHALAQSLISGFGSVFAFRLLDNNSRNVIQGRYGRNKRMYSYISSNTSKGVQDSLEIGEVIEDWDISSLKIGQCIAMLPDEEPFKFYPLEYKKRG